MRDEIHLDASRFNELERRRMCGTPDATVTHIDFTGVLLGVRDEFGQRLVGAVAPGHQDRLGKIDAGDGLKILQGVKRNLSSLRHELVKAIVREDQGVAVLVAVLLDDCLDVLEEAQVVLLPLRLDRALEALKKVGRETELI